jgi:hypothetical protein
MADDAGLARAAPRELPRAQPNVSLAWIAEFMPIKPGSDRQRYLGGFCGAGLS